MTIPPGTVEGSRRLGTFGGVFTPSILTILGVIMYLRFGWVVGSVGLAGALLISFISHFISVTTGLSVSSIATNRTVGPGGTYYMISRSLGAPAGAAVGIPLFFAEALSVTFYVVGFSESISYLAPGLDPRLVGTLTIALIALIAARSAELAIKTQFFVMAAIGLSLVSLFAGGAEEPPASIEWWNSEGPSFSHVLAVFFPAVTGITIGVSMSGDLKDPRRSIPRGTMFAILTGFAVYTAIPFFLAWQGDNRTLVERKDFVFEIAAVPSLIYVGVWGATLSSAVGSILAAPRTLQALANDGLAPRFFAKGHGPTNEPRNGLFFTFALAQVGILIGSLDLIAPILTMFFLATYGVANLVCGLERWASNPSFRPTFRVPAWLSLAGAVGCFYVMSIIDFPAMLAALVVCGFIYVSVERRNLNTTFGDVRHGLWAALVRTALQRMHQTAFHPMSWRPNLLIFGGDPERRRHMMALGSALVQDRGIVSYTHLIHGDVVAQAPERRARQEDLDGYRHEFPNVFPRVDIVDDFFRGTVTIAQSHGIGLLEANSVMLGWTGKPERASPYFAMLRELSHLHRSILLLHHDPSVGFGQRREIHIWWGGLQSNGALMLLIAWLLTCHQDWREAKVTVLTAVTTDEAEARARDGLQRVFGAARLEATPRVLRSDRPVAELMQAESGAADLVILGLRLPEDDAEVPAVYARYMELLAGLPTALLVHAGQHFDGAPVLFDE